MDTTTLNIPYLESIGTCKTGIKFVTENNLLNFPVDLLGDVKGDSKGYIKSIRGRVKIVKEYDSQGNVISRVDSNGRLRLFEYDSRGNMTKSISPNGVTQKWEYDSKDNMTKRVDHKGGVSLWEYDSRGNKIKSTNPLGSTQYWEYDSRGNLIKEVGTDGSTKDLGYDSRNNIIRCALSSGIVNTWEYIYTSKGSLKTIKSNGVTTLDIPNW